MLIAFKENVPSLLPMHQKRMTYMFYAMLETLSKASESGLVMELFCLCLFLYDLR